MSTNLINRRSNLGKAISVIARAAVVLVLALPLSVAAQQRYELPAVLSASRILPAELLSGPNHRVQERVTNDGIVNIYKIDSKFGPFDDLGASTVTGTGRVYNLNNLSHFSGNYVATQATFAVAGGSGELTMTNGKGVVVSLSSQESGTQLTAGPSGISLKLK
jgi:hypothetical protein